METTQVVMELTLEVKVVVEVTAVVPEEVQQHF
jgi:hypothetical protein